MMSSNSSKILLVEDSDTDALLLQESILSSGATDISISVVQSLKEAEEYLKNNHPDAVLLDLTLPDSSGLDTVRRVRQISPDLPIVVLTGIDDENMGVEALRTGVQDYLVKGQTDGRTITRVIHYSIERKQAEEAIKKAATRFEILSDTASKLLESKNPQQIINALCSRVMEYLDCHIFVNYLVDEQAHRLHLNAASGLSEKMAKDIEWLDFGQAICGRVAKEGKRIVAENIQESCDARADLVRSVGIKAYACHPIISQDKVIGTLSFGTRARKTFSDDDLATMKTVTDQVATAMERVRAEGTLRESETKYRELVQNANSVIIRWKRDGTIIFFNEYAQKLFGYSADEAVGRKVNILVPEKESTGGDLTGMIQNIVAQPESYINNINENICRDGRRIWMAWTNKPIFDENGKVMEILAVGTEVTERKQIEDAMKFLVDCGSPASGEDFFLALACYLGQSLGMDFVCIDRLEENLLAARTLAVYSKGKFEDNISYALKDTPCGNAVGKSICTFTKDVRHLFPKDKVLADLKAESYVGTTLWSSKGHPIGLIAIIGRKPLADTKLAASILQLVAVRAASELERRQTEEAVLVSEVRYRRLFEAARDGILILDSESGKIVDVNPFIEEMLGYSHNEFLDKHVWEIGLFKDVVASKDSFLELQNKGYVRYENLPLETKDGRHIAVEFVSNVYNVDHHKVIQCNIRDITDRAKAEEALRQSNEELNRFNLAAVGRELRLIELKKEINNFCDSTGQPPRYPLDFEKENDNGKNETRIT